MANHLHRREFFQQIAAGSIALVSGSWGTRRAFAGPKGANERLNIGIIGTAGRASANIQGVQGENIVALCDIDDRLLGRASERFPGARTYNDFRKLLEQPDLDAVVISTADHVHAPAAIRAMRLGKHVYCEKPLSHTVEEARLAARVAAETKVATQMGTQIHASNNYRRVVELIRAGAIGPVCQCFVWCNKSWSGGERPMETPPVPAHLHWDLWLGPAPERPYHPTYQPANWRRWWDFGSGTLGDMACHLMDLAHWALDLRHPVSVSAQGPPAHPETTPRWLVVQYEYPARGDKPPVQLTWYDGENQPALPPETKLPRWSMGVLFMGAQGLLLANYDRRILYPESQFRDYVPPEPSIPASIGHHAEWLAACKTGGSTSCNFDYSGALTEAVLLGNVAYRVGKKLDWDADTLRASTCPEAERYVRSDYRKGWDL
jgi:predicted dehydrogenase